MVSSILLFVFLLLGVVMMLAPWSEKLRTLSIKAIKLLLIISPFVVMYFIALYVGFGLGCYKVSCSKFREVLVGLLFIALLLSSIPISWKIKKYYFSSVEARMKRMRKGEWITRGVIVIIMSLIHLT